MRRGGAGQAKAFLLVSLIAPVFLIAQVYPDISLWWFKRQEPFFILPLAGTSLQIREDAYGKGHFGARRNGGRKHRGIDLTAKMHTPVLAAKSGKAIIGKRKDGMGNYIVVEHPDGFKTRYGHLSRIFIQDGQPIERGDLIGAVGKSGNAKHRLIQPHVHFEIWNAQGEPVDPLEHMEIAGTVLKGGQGERETR